MFNAHPGHSVKQVFAMAFPLIASAFSWTLMISFDRLMLAKFDIDIMNAVVSLGSLLFLFEWSITSITVTTEIFAGQYNGMNKKNMSPIATWQMLFFSVFSLAIFLFAGLFLGKYIIPEVYYEAAGDFYKVTMCFLVFSPATAAINGFFIGIKQPKIILFNAVSCNIINIILSYVLIFGVSGYIQPKGALGAAIATSIAIFIQFIVIFSIFLSRKYNEIFKTRVYDFNKKIFAESLRIGVPSSIGLITEMLGNYTGQLIIIILAPEYMSNHNIALNVFIFTTFFLNGMNKATSGLAANILGAKKLELLPELFISSLKLHFGFSCVVILITVIFGEQTAKLYTNDPIIIAYTKITLPWVALHFFCDGIGWIISGILTAGGDTKFLMYSNTIIIWLFRVLPIFILLKVGVSYVAIGWIISSVSTMIYAVVFYARYRSMKWIKIDLS